MTDNEQKFFDYWKTNMFRKTSAPTDKVLHAYFLLHGKHLNTTCSNCMSRYAQELKNVFHSLLKAEENAEKQRQLDAVYEPIRAFEIDSKLTDEQLVDKYFGKATDDEDLRRRCMEFNNSLPSNEDFLKQQQELLRKNAKVNVETEVKKKGGRPKKL